MIMENISSSSEASQSPMGKLHPLSQEIHSASKKPQTHVNDSIKKMNAQVERMELLEQAQKKILDQDYKEFHEMMRKINYSLDEAEESSLDLLKKDLTDVLADLSEIKEKISFLKRKATEFNEDTQKAIEEINEAIEKFNALIPSTQESQAEFEKTVAKNRFIINASLLKLPALPPIQEKILALNQILSKLDLPQLPQISSNFIEIYASALSSFFNASQTAPIKELPGLTVPTQSLETHPLFNQTLVHTLTASLSSEKHKSVNIQKNIERQV